MSDTFSLYDLRVTVAEIGGRSVCGMSVGDGSICATAANSCC